jgi:hypothetical protein
MRRDDAGSVGCTDEVADLLLEGVRSESSARRCAVQRARELSSSSRSAGHTAITRKTSAKYALGSMP